MTTREGAAVSDVFCWFWWGVPLIRDEISPETGALVDGIQRVLGTPGPCAVDSPASDASAEGSYNQGTAAACNAVAVGTAAVVGSWHSPAAAEPADAGSLGGEPAQMPGAKLSVVAHYITNQQLHTCMLYLACPFPRCCRGAS